MKPALRLHSPVLIARGTPGSRRRKQQLLTASIASVLVGVLTLSPAAPFTFTGALSSAIESFFNYNPPNTVPADSLVADQLNVDVTVTNQPQLTVSRSLNRFTFTGTNGGFSLGGAFTLSLGTGGLTTANVGGTNIISAGTTLNFLGTGAGTTTSVIDVASGGTLRINGNIASAATGGVTITKSGAGLLELNTGTSSFSPATSGNNAFAVTGGTVRVIGGSGGVSGGTSGSRIVSLALTNGAIYDVFGGDVTSGQLSGTAMTTLTSTSLTRRTFTAGQQTATTFAGLISGNLNFVQSAGSTDSTLTLSNSLNSYTGTTSVTGNSTLLVAGNAPNGGAGVTGVLGNSITAVSLGAAAAQSANLLTFGAFTIGRDVTANVANTSTLAVGGNGNFNSAFTGNITITRTGNQNFTLQSAATGANAVTFSGNIVGTGTAGITIGATVTTYTGVSTTTGTANQGNIILSGTNNYLGSTTISGGNITASGNQAFGSLTAATAGLILNPASGTGAGAATVIFSSATPEIASLASNGTGLAAIILGNALTNSATALTTGGNNASTSFAGVISDVSGSARGSVNKTGAGTFTVAGANTYRGGTTLTGGSMTVTAAGATLGTGNVSVLNTAITLTIGSGVAISDTATLSLAGSATPNNLADNGFLTLNANETVGGLILGTTVFGPGTYGSTASSALIRNNEFFAGTGILTVIPEPGALVSLVGGFGLLLGSRRFRRRRG